MKISEKILNALKHSNLSENILKQSINHKNSLISPCLISDYLESYLYTSKNSFYKKKPRIGRLNKNMNFSKMRGTADYIKELNNVYPKGKYLTASELLTPYFGYTIGNYILKSHELFHAEKPLIIVEVGCGMGGLADSILSFFKNYDQKIYKTIQYISFEITDNLVESSIDLLRRNHFPLVENNQISIIKNSIYNLDNLNINEHCYILAFDFLDAIAHDCVNFDSNYNKKFQELITNFLQENIFLLEKDNDLNTYRQLIANFTSFLEKNFFSENLVQQFQINYDADIFKHFEHSNHKLIKTQLTDKDIKEILSYQLFPKDLKKMIIGNEFVEFERKKIKTNEDTFIRFSKIFYNYYFNNNTMWVPSKAIKFLDFINKNFPNHNLIFHDFDYLPVNIFVKYKGLNAPIVYSLNEDDTNIQVFKELVNPPGEANVYFPVDFELIQLIYKMRYNKSSSIRDFSSFMTDNSLKEWGLTRFGFNPLIETHKNTKFLLTIN